MTGTTTREREGGAAAAATKRSSNVATEGVGMQCGGGARAGRRPACGRAGRGRSDRDIYMAAR